MIGINTAGALDPNTGVSVGMNYAITINELAKILDTEQIEYTMGNGGSGLLQPWMGYVCLPIGLLALAGGVVMMMQASKESGIAPAQPNGAQAGRKMQQNENAAEKKIVLKGITGQYAGQRFDLTKGSVVIGRDPSVCNIIFDQNTPGISGRHCRVAYDAGQGCLLLTDLGSSYGTYLDNGKKLTANETEKLFAGDGFCLCDSNNRFIVTRE